MNPFPLRRLLWFDCSAAGVAGMAMLALGGVLAPLLGLPRALLLFTAVVNLVYGVFSLSLALRPVPPRRGVKVLAGANFAWVACCVAMALYFAGPGRWWGAGFLLGEGVFVGVLAAIEARALAAS